MLIVSKIVLTKIPHYLRVRPIACGSGYVDPFANVVLMTPFHKSAIGFDWFVIYVIGRIVLVIQIPGVQCAADSLSF